MTLATLGSILIVLGIAVLAAGVALPVAYAIRMRATAESRRQPVLRRISA
jgi:hypothetical protein